MSRASAIEKAKFNFDAFMAECSETADKTIELTLMEEAATHDYMRDLDRHSKNSTSSSSSSSHVHGSAPIPPPVPPPPPRREAKRHLSVAPLTPPRMVRRSIATVSASPRRYLEESPLPQAVEPTTPDHEERDNRYTASNVGYYKAEAMLSKHFAVPWSHRGPPPPTEGGPTKWKGNTTWRAPNEKGTSGGWYTRGGKNKEWRDAKYGKKKKN